MRLFIAVELPVEVKTYLQELQDQIKLFDETAKLTYAKEFHITLKFLGEVDDSKVEQIKFILDKVPLMPFTVRLAEPGYFDDQKLRVLWVGVDDLHENILDLQKAVDKQLLYYFPKETKFSTHITLARVKHVEAVESFITKLSSLKVEEKSFKINSFKLIKSTLTREGAQYEVLKEYKE